MAAQFTIYGAKGTGSVIVEAARVLLDQPYELVDEPDAALDRQAHDLLSPGCFHCRHYFCTI